MPTRQSAIQIRVDDQHIDGTLVAPSAVVPGVLLVHGWDGSQDQYIARAHLKDVLAAYDELVRHPAVDPASVAIVGSSYGGYLAALLSSLRPVRWLALRAPALYRDENWNQPKGKLDVEDLKAYRQTAIEPSHNRALAACSEFRGDVLIVESEHDRTIPPPVIKNYVNAFGKVRSITYRVLSEADHALSGEEMRKAYGEQLLGWMGEMVKGARAVKA